MRFSDGGYSHVQYDPKKLRNAAQRLSFMLPGIMRSTGAQAVAVTGKSGMALAFATLMLIDFPLIVVRKQGENCHGLPVEGTEGISITKYLILDDFISSGRTVDSIDSLVAEAYEMSGGSLYNAPAECVGIVEYLRDPNDHHRPFMLARTGVTVPVFGTKEF